jgi:hypothetical protein
MARVFKIRRSGGRFHQSGRGFYRIKRSADRIIDPRRKLYMKIAAITAGVLLLFAAGWFAYEPIVQALVKAHGDLGLECPFYGTPQHDDADFLSNMAHIPTVIYGPGTGVMAHVPDEYVLLDELRESARVYALTILHALKG